MNGRSTILLQHPPLRFGGAAAPAGMASSCFPESLCCGRAPAALEAGNDCGSHVGENRTAGSSSQGSGALQGYFWLRWTSLLRRPILSLW